MVCNSTPNQPAVLVPTLLLVLQAGPCPSSSASWPAGAHTQYYNMPCMELTQTLTPILNLYGLRMRSTQSNTPLGPKAKFLPGSSSPDTALPSFD
jgi:hypothetical protein